MPDEMPLSTMPTAATQIAAREDVRAPPQAALVAFGGPNGASVFALWEADTVVGRGEEDDDPFSGGEAQIHLSESTVSRRHARICRVDGAWFVEDLDSCNKTRINGRVVYARMQVHDGDLLEFGNQKLKFVWDVAPIVENQSRLREVLTIAASRARDGRDELCLMLINVRGVRMTNEHHGLEAGDVVLHRIGEIVESCCSDASYVGRFGGAHFAVVLVNASMHSASELAARIVRCIQEEEFDFDSYAPWRMDAAIGHYHRRPTPAKAVTAEQMITGAQGALFRAIRTNVSDRIIGATERDTREMEVQARDYGRSLLNRLRGDESIDLLVAFELDNERQILDQLGPSTLETWFGALVDSVTSSMQHSDAYGTLLNRYVFLGVSGSRTREASPAELAAAVVESWNSRVPQAIACGFHQPIRFASMERCEVEDVGDHAIDALVARLVPKADGSRYKEARLPYPLCGPLAYVASIPGAQSRCDAVVKATESALKMLVAMFVAAVRQFGDEGSIKEVIAVFDRQLRNPTEVPSLGSWHFWAKDTAPIARACGTDLVKSVAGLLVDRPRTLARLHGIRDFRNEFLSHNHPAGYHHPDVYEDKLPTLIKTLREFVADVSGHFAEVELVSVETSKSIEEDPAMRSYSCKIYDANLRSNVIRVLPSGHLQEGRTYLIASGEMPVRMEPFVTIAYCRRCNRWDAFGAKRALFCDRDSFLEMVDMFNGHSMEHTVPWGPEDRLLAETVRSLGYALT